jgi:hypothetical protein
VFIIFGFRRKSSRLGTIFIICGYCHTPAAHALVKMRKYFTLFFVPVIPLDTTYAITCTMCGRSTRITKEIADSYMASADQGPSASNRPAAPSPAYAPASMPGTATAAAPTAAPSVQPEQQPSVIYCSWCGKERAVNAQAIHHCGSRERPSVYCMDCGTLLVEGAPTCGSCGTPATKLSR